ncbi:hypothetical protein GOODEAATRI_006375, partial [Goodea atripinnis]
MHVDLAVLRHTNSPYSSANSLTHTDSVGSYDLMKGISTEKAKGRGGKGLQEGVKGNGIWIEWDFVGG